MSKAKELLDLIESKNEIKAKVKKELLLRYSADVVTKGMARGERWMKQAYGEVDYSELESEQGNGSLASWFSLYCDEIKTSDSVNTDRYQATRRK